MALKQVATSVGWSDVHRRHIGSDLESWLGPFSVADGTTRWGNKERHS